ncbi:serine/threonine protein kinase, FIKK family [Plasmodium gonderi]|uniref:non-specific serine/threonine protein kinase n=1 Tax=Plasmodium gonderi TaxID=77519 RepID=A0A1Y1J9N6_PLAGO|nr:serine/threonine protein kinase, FIKK family [Plasmodium gonderi]GAW78980.1 serine/threonine protein kinase, FIKK family [Plasmodium gonderi]
MIETTGEIKYTKSKTIVCDSSNGGDDDDSNNYLSLKYEKTLDLEKENDKSNTLNNKGKKCKNDEQNFSIKSNTTTESPKKDTYDDKMEGIINGGSKYFDLDSKMIKKTSQENSSHKGNRTSPQNTDIWEEKCNNICMGGKIDYDILSNDNMYSKNVISTKYYDNAEWSCTVRSADSNDANGCNNVSTKKYEESSMYRDDDDEEGKKRYEMSDSLGKVQRHNTFVEDYENVMMDKKEIFSKNLEHATKKNKIDRDGNNKGNNSGNNSDNSVKRDYKNGYANMNKEKKDYNNEVIFSKEDDNNILNNETSYTLYLHANKDSLTSSINCENNNSNITDKFKNETQNEEVNQSDDGKGESLMKYYEKFLSKKDSGFDEDGNDNLIDHLFQDKNKKCNSEDDSGFHSGIQKNEEKMKECNMNNKDFLYEVKEDLKGITSNQDIFNEMENVNDSTTECTSSVKDIPIFIGKHAGVYENRPNEKIENSVNSMNSGDFTTYKDVNSTEYKSFNSTKFFHGENEIKLTFNNSEYSTVVNNASMSVANNASMSVANNASMSVANNASMSVANNASMSVANNASMSVANNASMSVANNTSISAENEDEEKSAFEILLEVGAYNNRAGGSQYFPASHNINPHCGPLDPNNENGIERKYTVSEKRIERENEIGQSNIPINSHISSNKVNNDSRNYNPNKRDSFQEELFYKKKEIHSGKEGENMKEKNESTLRNSQILEYSKKENEESLEEYFKSTIPDNILRNIKYENPSNTFNDIANNTSHYDLTSALRINNPSNMFYASGRNREKGERKGGEMITPATSVGVSHMGLRSRGGGAAAAARRDAYHHTQGENVVDSREEVQMKRKQNNGNYNCASSGGNMGNMGSMGNSSYNSNNYGNYYNNEKDLGMVSRNTRMCNEPESNYASGKRYYLLPPKKCDAMKEQKNQVLMISKQKIKKIWNKFKGTPPKEQNLIPTFENEQNLFSNMDVLQGPRFLSQRHTQVSPQMGMQKNSQMNAKMNAHVNAQMNAHVNAQMNVHVNAQMNAHVNAQMNAHVNAQMNSHMNAHMNSHMNAHINTPMHSEIYGLSSPLLTNNQSNRALMSPFKDCINKPIQRGNNMIEKQIKAKCIFNWKLAQKSLLKMLHSAHNYYFNGVKYSDWQLTCIPTLGFSKSSNRVQQMCKAVIPSNDGKNKNEVKLFLKKVPIYIWVKQFNLMNEYDGEYVTDGENFVMEATSLAFLNDYHPGITPKLHKILYEPDSKQLNEYNNIPPKSMFNSLTLFNDILTERLKCNMSGNIVIVSEFFSEDILDFIDRRQKKLNMKINNNEKSYILYQCLKLLIRLHDAGLSHLDLTPENILISENYEMRLCDLSKSTPIYTYNLRHIKDTNRLYLFESCEPTIAKGAYMPPECWKIYWKYDTMKIKNPLKDLKNITDQEKRKQFYFDVSSADKFMLGVFFFWIWTNGNLWKCSDPLQDEDFFYFVKCDMNFDKFELTRKWPSELKNIIKQLLHAEHRKKLNLKDLSIHPWWSCKLQ